MGTVKKDFSKLFMPFKPVVEPATQQVKVERGSSLTFPEAALYGKLGQDAHHMDLPLGLAYPALLGVYSVLPVLDEYCCTRINAYVCLVTGVGGGKNVAMKRARLMLGVEPGEYCKLGAPAGSRGLMLMIGDKPGKTRKEARVPGPEKMLLCTNEITDVFKSASMENSTLASRICDLWDENVYDAPSAASGECSCDCRFSWIGGLPATTDDPARFSQLFGAESAYGMYDRFIFGYADEYTGERFKYRDWTPPAKQEVLPNFDDYCGSMPHFVESVAPDAAQRLESWNPETTSSRMHYHAKKIAVLTAHANGDRVVSLQCMDAAITFMEWQIAIRKALKPGEALNAEAALYELMVDKFLRLTKQGKAPFAPKRVAHDAKWADKYGPRMVQSTVKNMVDSGVLIHVYGLKDGRLKADQHRYFLNPELFGDEAGDKAKQHVQKVQEHRELQAARESLERKRKSSHYSNDG